MFKLVEGLPPDVLAIEASGKITHEDYRDFLIPKAEAMLASGRIDMLFVIDSDMSGISLEGLWDDNIFAINHWGHIAHIAIVTDQDWIRSSASLFRPFFPGEFRLFRLAELPAAKAWITAVNR